MHAIGLMLMSLFLYPEYLRVPVGPVLMSVPRLIALVMMIRFVTRPGPVMKLRLQAIDTLIVIAALWDVIAVVATDGDAKTLTSMLGRPLDTVIVYFAVRLAVARDSDYSKLIWPLWICAVVMGMLGSIEAITTFSPYTICRGYYAWTTWEKPPDSRFGLMRAQASLSHAIYFGLAMMIVTGTLFSLRGFASRKIVWITGCIAGSIGVLSSLSSGPTSALCIWLLASLLYARWRLIKAAIVAVVGVSAFYEIFSSHHCFYLVEYLDVFGGSSWYRGRLMEVAVAHLEEYWLFGVGSQWPDHWGALIDGRGHVDVVNNYIIVMLTSGLPGLLLWLAVVAAAIQLAGRAWKQAGKRHRQAAFGFCTVLIAMMAGTSSIGLFSAPLLTSYIVLALATSLPVCVEKRAPGVERHVCIARPLLGATTGAV
jgi:hypothetical protein